VHITAPRVLGFLMLLALIGYTFCIGPWISANASTRSPASSVPVPLPVPRVEPSGGATPTVPISRTEAPSRVSAKATKATTKPSRVPGTDSAVRPAAVRTLSRAPLLLSRAK
jgi:hypothetical protein